MRAHYAGGREVLDNQNTVITLRDQNLQVVGIDDAYTGHARRGDGRARALRRDLPTIGLSHIAEEADRSGSTVCPWCSRATPTPDRSRSRACTSCVLGR